MNFNVIKLDNVKSEICLSAFPGRQRDDKFSGDMMDKFFSFLDTNKFKALVSLVEVHEFDDYVSLHKFKKIVSQNNFDWHHHPLKDMTAPNEAFLFDFAETQSTLIDYLLSGEKIAIHCKGGLGRSGTIAAMLLCDIGVSATNSIELVRLSRPGAIETREQEMFIQGVARKSLNA